MRAKDVKMVAGAANEPEMTVAQLAAEQAEQRKMLRALQRLTVAHVKECGKLQKITADTLVSQADSLAKIEARFALFDKVCHFLIKNGKKLAYTTLSAFIAAYVGVLAQNYLLHRETTIHAEDAASKAAAASSAVQQIPDQTVKKLEAAHAVAP